jgi:L-threonylcarbamoyladenylate synthase
MQGRPLVIHSPSTRVIGLDPDDPDPSVLDLAAGILKQGGLVAFATETVYGLGAIATNSKAVARIFEAKGRPTRNPVIVHVTGVEQARECVDEWPQAAETLAAQFWPGPLTLVLKRSAKIPDIVTAGLDTVAVRAPLGKVALGLIERTGQPIAAPSANRSNRLSPTRALHVLADLDGRIDLIIDSGPTVVGLESTVIDLTMSVPRVLRPGPIEASKLASALGGVPLVEHVPSNSIDRPASPGLMPVHYAPSTSSFRADSLAELETIASCEDIGVVILGEQSPSSSLPQLARRVALETPAIASQLLYETLHQYDFLGLGAIVVVMPPNVPEWGAVRDRLLRATRPLGERR